MQFKSLTTGLAAAILATTVSAENLNSTGAGVPNRAKVINNCPYKVYLWSVLKGDGCRLDDMVTLDTGGFYHEAYRQDSTVGVSIKISKTTQCKGPDITQLEYFEERANPKYAFNYLDVSYVDCHETEDRDCPGRSDGYFLKAGNAGKATTADTTETWCPTFSCTDEVSCDLTSYVDPHDEQTKTCGIGEPIDFYLCGEGQQGSDEEEPEPSASASPSSQEEEESTPTATPTPSSNPDFQKAEVVAAAEITSAPAEQPKQHNVKTEVVYVTQYEYVNAKRHAHNHVHRHFRA